MKRPHRAPTAADVAHHYDRRYYHDLAERYLRRSRFARQRIRNLSSMLPPLRGRRVIDLGCGIGTFAFEAARAGATTVGVDPTREALRAASRIRQAEGVAGASFIRADAARLPIRSTSADVVIAADLTEHLDRATLEGVFREAARVLRAGGTFAIYTPSPSHLFERLRKRDWLLHPDPSHIGMRTTDELVAALGMAGFSVARIRFPPSHLPIWKLLESVLGRWVPLLRRRIGIVARKEEA